jgi:hypothetical protein
MARELVDFARQILRGGRGLLDHRGVLLGGAVTADP